MMSAGTAFARAASQPRVSGVRDFGIGADTSRHHQAIKHNSRLTENEMVEPLPTNACAGGITLPSSGSLSPGTGAALRELGCSVITSPGEAQAEIRKAIAKKEAARRTTRLIMGTNLIKGKV